MNPSVLPVALPNARLPSGPSKADRLGWNHATHLGLWSHIVEDDVPNEKSFTLGQVSHLTGIPKQTIQAWHHRYGASALSAGSDQMRRYSSSDIMRLKLLRRCVDTGHRIGSLVSMTNQQLRELLANSRLGAEKPRTIDRLLKFASEMRGEELLAELGFQLAALGPVDFADTLMNPLLFETGRRWADGQMSIAAEHLLSATIYKLLASALHLGSARQGQPRAVFCTPAREDHELGLLAAAVVAQRCGVRPLYLGRNVPATDIAIATARVGANIVSLSLTLGDRQDESIKEIEALLEAEPELTVWVGGQTAQPAKLSHLAQVHLFASLNEFDQHLTNVMHYAHSGKNLHSDM